MTTGGGALTGRSAARAAVGPRTKAATAPSMMFFLMFAPRNLSRLTRICLPDQECRTAELALQPVALEPPLDAGGGAGENRAREAMRVGRKATRGSEGIVAVGGDAAAAGTEVVVRAR